MLRTDYLMRMIEQVTQAIARVLQLKRAGRVDEAYAELQQQARNLAALDLEAITRLGADALLQLVADDDRAAWVARITAAYGDLLEDDGRPADARRACKAAFLIYDRLEERGTLPAESEHRDALAQVTERLSRGGS